MWNSVHIGGAIALIIESLQISGIYIFFLENPHKPDSSGIAAVPSLQYARVHT